MTAVLSARELVVERGARGRDFTLRVASLDLDPGPTLVVLGPNGAGTRTLLRALAGLEAPTAGRVERATPGAVTLVFQRPAAFAGSVAQNVRAALLGRGLSRAEIARRGASALHRFEIAPLAQRRAATLSGGELRRLALARAFVLEPSVLLLDEPFDDLDAAGQSALSLDLRRAIADTGVAVGMVTHDLRRALLLADRIAVLLDGAVAQEDARDAVLERPASRAVAEVVGMTNLVAGRVSAEGAVLEIDDLHRVPLAAPQPPGAVGWAGIRPENLKLDVGRGEGRPIGKGRVRNVVNDGVAVSVAVNFAGASLQTYLLAGRGLARTLAPGDPVSLSVRREHVHWIPDPAAPAPTRAGGS